MRNLILDVYNKTKVILGVFLVLSVFLCGIAGTAVDVWAAQLPNEGIKKLYVGTGSSKVELEPGKDDNHLISLNEDLTISFDWANIDSFEAGVRYDLPLPLYIESGVTVVDGLHIAIDPSGESPYDNPDNCLAIIYKSNTGKITIEFTSAGISHHYAHIELGCHLNADKSNADENGKITIPIGGGITIEVDTLKPSVLPTIAKYDTNNGRVNADGTVTWRLEYNPGDANYAGTFPNNIKDTIPEGMEFIKDTVSVKVNGTAKPITPSVDGKVVTFPIESGDEKKSIVIEYKTKLTNDEILKLVAGSGAQERYQNRANIYKENDKLDYHPMDVFRNVLPTNPQTNPISKSFDSLNPATKKATWAILVNAYGLVPNPFEVTDSLPENGYLSDISNVRINGKTPTSSALTVTGTSFVLDLYSAINADKTIEPNENGQYRITYETTVSNAAFGANDTGTKTLNTANLTQFGTFTGTRTATAAINPGSLSNRLIRKQFASDRRDPDDPSAWLFSFYLHVNENRLTVANPNEVTVTDTLPDNIEYVIKEAKKVEGDAIVGEITIDSNGKGFSTQVTDINGKYAKIEVIVKVTDKKLFGQSQNTDINNYVSLQHGSEDPQTDTAKGTLKIGKANVKLVDGYNPDTKEVTWRVAVNQSSWNIAIGKLTIVDTIPTGLKFVSAEFAPAGVTTRTAIYNDSVYDTDGVSQSIVNNDDGTTTVTWELNVKEAKRYDIWVKTKILFDSEFYNKTENTVFTNRATVKNDSGYIDTTPVASIAIPPQKILEKNGDFETGTNRMNFTVGVNPLNQVITTADEIKFEDVLSENLFLLKDTVKVYKATVSIGGNVHDNENPSIGKYSYNYAADDEITNSATIEYTRANNKLTITMPVPTDDTKTYLIKYQVLATEQGEVKNDISISGIDNVITNVKDEVRKTFRMSASGFAYKIPPEDQYTTLQVNKVDKDGSSIVFYLDNNPAHALDNDRAARFDIYDSKDATNKLAPTIVANPNGLFIIDNSKLVGLDSVWVKETKSPDGFIANNEMIEVSIKDLHNGLNIKNYRTEDEKDGKVGLTVKKQDEEGNYQTAFNDAKFALFTNEACSADSMVADSEKQMTEAGITYNDLLDGHIYYLKETFVPAGYAAAEVHEVLAGTNTSITVTNRKLASLTVFKKKIDGSFLAGAKITVFMNQDKTVIAKDENGNELKDIELLEGGTIIHLGDGPYWISETTVPEGYDAAEDQEVVVPTTTPVDIVNKKTPPKPPTPPTPDNPGSSGGDSPQPPVQNLVKKDANGVVITPNGTIIHTGQLWWPVWVMGALGAIFVIAGIIMAIVKRKRNYPED